jgi:hypothetical protein
MVFQSHPYLFADGKLDQFLELQGHLEGGYTPEILSKYSQVMHYKHGFRDLAIIPEENIVLWLAAEAGGAKGFFDKITSFGAKSNDEGNPENGLFESFRLQPDETEKYKFKVSSTFKRGCRSAGICIHWKPEAKLVAVGYENGEVAVYSFDPVKDATVVKEIFIMKVNTNRTLGVHLNPEKSLLYTISKGKKLRILNYHSKTVLTGRSGVLTARNTSEIGREQTHGDVNKPRLHARSVR